MANLPNKLFSFLRCSLMIINLSMSLSLIFGLEFFTPNKIMTSVLASKIYQSSKKILLVITYSYHSLTVPVNFQKRKFIIYPVFKSIYIKLFHTNLQYYSKLLLNTLLSQRHILFPNFYQLETIQFQILSFLVISNHLILKIKNVPVKKFVHF